MEQTGNDRFLDEIDRELRSLDVRLKKVMTEAEALLKNHFGESEKTQSHALEPGEERTDEKAGEENGGPGD